LSCVGCVCYTCEKGSCGQKYCKTSSCTLPHHGIICCTNRDLDMTISEGDKVKVVDIILPKVAEHNRPFYEQFRGLEGIVVDTGMRKYPNDSVPDIRIGTFTVVTPFRFKVKLEGFGIQHFNERELEKI
jgi:hypothetical protein